MFRRRRCLTPAGRWGTFDSVQTGSSRRDSGPSIGTEHSPKVSILITEMRGPESAEFASFDSERMEAVEARQQRVAEFLERHELDAVLLRLPENIAWFSVGADVTRFGGGQETTAALFVTPEARVVVTNDVDSPLLFEQEFAGTGFQLKERPWHEDCSALLADLCRGRRVGSDSLNGGTKFVQREFAELRLPLAEIEVKRLRQLGRIATHAVEATCRKTEPGRSELEIAAELAHRLVKHGAFPARLQVVGDDRAERHRHWAPGHFPVESHGTLGVVARRWGLHVAVTRTVCFQRPDESLREAYQHAQIAFATAAHFSRANEGVANVWSRVERIYDKFGRPDAWRTADQGEILGYAVREEPLVPNGERLLVPGTPLHWHPAVDSALVGDTLLVTEKGPELITPMEDWPKLTIEVKGRPVDLPALLRRDG